MTDPRLTFTIPEELKQRFDEIPWGVRSHVMRKLTEWFCDIYEKHGSMAIGIVLSGDFELSSIFEQELLKRGGGDGKA